VKKKKLREKGFACLLIKKNLTWGKPGNELEGGEESGGGRRGEKRRSGEKKMNPDIKR